jgi:hypothetical protein
MSATRFPPIRAIFRVGGAKIRKIIKIKERGRGGGFRFSEFCYDIQNFYIFAPITLGYENHYKNYN